MFDQHAAFLSSCCHSSARQISTCAPHMQARLKTCIVVGTKCTSKEKLVSVQFILKAENTNLSGHPINGCNEGCSIAAGALFLSHPTPNPVNNRGANLPESALPVTVNSPAVPWRYHSMPHPIGTWASTCSAIWKCNTKHITVH